MFTMFFNLIRIFFMYFTLLVYIKISFPLCIVRIAIGTKAVEPVMVIFEIRISSLFTYLKISDSERPFLSPIHPLPNHLDKKSFPAFRNWMYGFSILLLNTKF